ncbi:MAG: hypothetical protein IPG71_11680 [bacterium]|nr:hypothetical protein [bacterium]
MRRKHGRRSLRCDANVSVRRRGETEFRERTEMKNLNSIRSVERAIAAEAKRQIGIYESGGTITRQTLQWDDQTEVLTSMRVKEGSDDYRYFPEPDLPVLELTDDELHAMLAELPELPDSRRARYRNDYGLHIEAVYLLASDRALSDYFESLVAIGRSPTTAAAWVQGEVQRLLKENDWELSAFPVSAERLAGIIDAVENRNITRAVGKDLLRRMLSDTRNAYEIIAADGLDAGHGEDEIRDLIKTVLARFPDELAKYREGKTKMIGFFMGQIMQETKGKADPAATKDVLMQLLHNTE